MLLYREDIAKRGLEYFKHLSKEDSADGLLAAKLLARLCGGRSAEAYEMTVGMSAEQALADRRMIHPDVFPRYFQLGILPSVLPEADVTAAARHIAGQQAGAARQEALTNFILEQAKLGRTESFWAQWENFQEVVLDGVQTDSRDPLLADLMLGLARASASLEGDWDDFFTPKRSAEAAAYRLVRLASTDDAATAIVRQAIAAATDLGFAGSLSFYAAEAEGNRRKDAYGPRVVDPAVRDELDRVIQMRYRESPEGLVDADQGAFVAVIYRASPKVATEIVVSALKARPTLLPRIVATALRVQKWVHAEGGYEVTFDELPGLANHVDFAQVLAATASQDDTVWQSELDRELVRQFRKRAATMAATAPLSSAG